MKLLLCACLVVGMVGCSLSHADSINVIDNGWLNVNGAGGQLSYSKLSLSGSGPTFGTGTYAFGASGQPAYGVGRFATGYLTINTSAYALSGALNTVYFNPYTGTMAGNFIGYIQWAGMEPLHIYHARFYETFNMQTHSAVSGRLLFATGQVPEPGTLSLVALGLAGVWKRYRKTRTE